MKNLSFSLIMLVGCPYPHDWCEESSGSSDPYYGHDTYTVDDDDEEYDLFLTPSEAHPGDTFMASVTVVGDGPSLLEVTEVVFFGDVNVLASLPRYDELLLTLEIPVDAETGPVDLLLELESGYALWMEEALLIY